MDTLVQQQYDRFAQIYELRWQFYITKSPSFLLEWAAIAPEAKVLDVACGTGELERQLTTQHPQQRIVGVDFSAQMLAIAQQKCAEHPHISFQQASASTLPWQHPQFDVVICANAFHYFDHPHAVLGEMQRVLQANGRVILLDWCRDFVVCRMCDWVLGWFDPAHKRCYTEAELHELLVTAGYRIQRSQRVRFGLIWGLMAIEAVMD